MVMKTTVLIRQLSGPQMAPDPRLNYQVWQSTSRLVGEQEITIGAPLPVRLDADGNGSVEVRPGYWIVTEVVPQGASAPRVVDVPVSAVPVFYDTLVEVTDLSNIGFGPSWAQQAIFAAAQAEDAVTRAEDARDAAEAFLTTRPVWSNSFLSRDVDGVLFFNAGATAADSVPLYVDTDGVLYFTD